MGAIQRKYGAAAEIDGIPLIALGSMDYKANPTLAAGDVKISKDGGAFASIEGAGTFGDFVAVAPASGTSVQVKPDATAMTCKTLVIRFIDQTSPKEWEDQEVVVETYGHASAMHPFDLGTAMQLVDVSKINGNSGAAAKLALGSDSMLQGTIDDTAFSPTTSQFEADDITEATADHYNGRVIVFTSGNLIRQMASIQDYSLVGGRGHFTVSALTEAPANNDTFLII